MTAKRALISWVIALWLAGGSSAMAAEPDLDLVLVGGGAGERERATAGAAIEAVTRSAGWQLPAAPPSRKDAAALHACAGSKQPWDCVPAQLRAVRRMLVVGVESRTHEGASMVVLTGRAIIASEQLAVIGERYCESCGEDALSEASAELAIRLLRELAVRSGRTTVTVRSQPTGAQIMLDGERIGAIDATFSTYPGTHTVLFEKPGYFVESREVTVGEGEAVEVAATWRSSGFGQRPSPSAGAEETARAPSRPSQLPPALVVGGGAALIAVGAVLLALDEDSSLESKAQRVSLYYFDSAPSRQLRDRGRCARRGRRVLVDAPHRVSFCTGRRGHARRRHRRLVRNILGAISCHFASLHFASLHLLHAPRSPRWSSRPASTRSIRTTVQARTPTTTV
jgi:PEGA domain